MGSAIGFALAEFISIGFFAFYQRSGLDRTVKEIFQNATYSDLIVDEIFLPSFEYNRNRPRFYSKYFRKVDPLEIDVPLRKAASASSSAPGFFDPQHQTNGYGMVEDLIDGALICNSPALFAY